MYYVVLLEGDSTVAAGKHDLRDATNQRSAHPEAFREHPYRWHIHEDGKPAALKIFKRTNM